MVVDSIPQLIAPTKELEEVLHQVEQASLLFSNPNPAIMREGEAIFLHIRQSPAALDFACFALCEYRKRKRLSHEAHHLPPFLPPFLPIFIVLLLLSARTRDAFVLKQAFQAIEDNLPSLPLDNPTRFVSSLSTLRDFLLAVILARSAIEKTKPLRTAKSSSSSTQSWSDKGQYSWPKHAELQAYRTFAAVEKRLIGLQVDAIYQQNGPVFQAIETHTHDILSQLVGLSSIPDSWPENEEQFLIAQSNFTVGIEVLNALLDEFSTLYSVLDSDGNQVGKASNIDHSGLLPIQHRWCKAIAQTYIIPSLLDLVTPMLYSTLPDQKQANKFFLFKPLISLLTRIVSWNFVLEEPFAGLEGTLTVERQAVLLKNDENSTDTIKSDDDENEDENDNTATRRDHFTLRIIPSTHVSMISKNVISVVQLAYKYVATLESHSQASFCITELQTCFHALTSSRQYVDNEANRLVMMESKHYLLQAIMTIIDDIPNSDKDSKALCHKGVFGNSLLFASQIFYAFLTSTESKQLLLAVVNLSNLIESLSTLTELVFHFAFESRADSDEEFELLELGDEAIDYIFGSWRYLLPYSTDNLQDEASQRIREITFNTVVRPYIELRLLQAGSMEENDSTNQSDYGQENVPDVEKYQEQLITLASLARDANLTACLHFVVECSISLFDQLQHYHHNVKEDFNGLSGTEEEEEKNLKSIWEQTHWITLIGGHLIADQSKGEVATIAQEIVLLSNEGQADILRLVQSLGFNIVDLCSKPNNSRLQSPRVMETALWFNARWIPIYLLLDTTPLLSTQFNNQTGQELLQYLLVRLQDIIQLWASDTDVVLQVAAVLKAFTLSEGTMQVLLGLQQFQETVKLITDKLDLLPAKTHGPLISAIIGCIYTSSTTQSPESFFNYIKQAIEGRLGRIIHQPNFTLSTISQRSDTIVNLLNALDMLDGLARSVQPKSANAIYDFLSKFFDTLSGLAQLYHERNEVVISIISVYRTLIGALDLGFGASTLMLNGLNTAVSSLLNHIDEKSLLGDSPEMALEEDVPFEGLCLVIDLLSDLMLASENDAADPRLWFGPISPLQTSDVCLQGFSRITPLLNKNNAQSIARVRRKFANLTSKLWISFPHRILGIAINASSEESMYLFQSCTSALVISLKFVESTLLIDCFAAIHQLSIAVEKVLNMIGSVSTQILNILNESLNSILTTILNGVLIEPIATSLFDIHLLSTRALIRTLSNDKMGGMSSLETQMANYCATNILVSQYATRETSTNQALDSLKDQEAERKRSALSQVVIQLITLGLQGQAETRNSIQGRQEESAFLVQARKVAWEGRAKIRAS